MRRVPCARWASQLRDAGRTHATATARCVAQSPPAGETRFDLRAIPAGRVRNFGIIAHIDHGKSTLADRLLELTGCAAKSGGRTDRAGGRASAPTLDMLPVERERGITVKAQTASMFYQPPHGPVHLLNLIDTPGHADFTNEVARSLAAMQGVLLVVDAVAGVQAQTVAHYWRAREHGLCAILPVINKIDLPQANVDLVLEQLESQLSLDVLALPILAVSARSGLNVEQILPAVVERIPPPAAGRADGAFEAVLIDCWYREFRGVVCLVSVRSGAVQVGDCVRSAVNDSLHIVEEVGILQPELVPSGYLHAGQVGYVRCGMRSTQDAVIGDTLLGADAPRPAHIVLPARLKPIVFSGMFPVEREEYEAVGVAVGRLLLNDSSVSVEKITSAALGPGWRLGFLGSLHMDVFRQRLEQEFGVCVVMTSPSVTFHVYYKDRTEPASISAAEDFPSEAGLANVREFREPLVKATIIVPASAIGPVSQLCAGARGSAPALDFLGADRVRMCVCLPLIEIIGGFNDRLLSLSAGYASLDYEPWEYARVALVKVGIRLNGDLVDILSTVQPEARAVSVGRQWAAQLAALLPQQQFAVAVQAVIGTRVIARETISARRKDVIAKCYGGDRTRKMKLLEAQKRGKARMRLLGRVEVPHETFVSIMKISSAQPT